MVGPTEKELDEKLRALPRVALKAVAARAALQTLPFIFSLANQGSSRIGRQYLLLTCLRAGIVSGVQATRPHSEISALNADMIADHRAACTDEVIDSIPKAALSTLSAIGCATSDASDGLIANLITYDWDGFRERTVDASALTVTPQDTETVFATKLWHGETPKPYYILSQQFFDSAPGTPWEFWAEWYEGMLNGTPMDWELQRQVALIDNDVWKIGPDAVAQEIERIRARWEVETALADLIEGYRTQSGTRHGIGGNNPPERIQDERLSGAITLIWEAEEELSDALQQENPAREWIEGILAKFKSGLASYLRWCASKGDIAIDTLIKWGVPATGAGYAAKHPDKIEALIEALERWLPFLS